MLLLSKNRIVFVIDSLGFGGREKAVIDIANGLAEQKVEVYIISFSNDVVTQADNINKNITTILMPFRRNALGGLKALVFWIKGMSIYITHLRKIRPAITHTHLLFQQFLFGSLGIRLSRIKTKQFHTVHTAGLYFSGKGFINKVRLYTEQLAVRINRTHIIAVSQAVKDNCIRFFGKYARAVDLIPNGVNVEKFDASLRGRTRKIDYGFSNTDLIITYVARMDEGKDHMTLLKAWTTIAKRHPQIRLCLVGNGELMPMLKRFVSDNEIGRSVVFMNSRQDVQLILAISDIAVFPSLFEGLPISMLEKMFMKLPVVASSIAPVTTILKDGYNGLLFEPKDYEALAEKLELMIANESFRSCAGENAFNSVQSYNSDTMIKKHMECYEAAISH